MILWLALAACLVACSDEPERPPPSERQVADAEMRDLYAQASTPPSEVSTTPATDPVAATTPSTDAAVDAAPAPELKILWGQISTLHRGFFNDPRHKAALAGALAPHLRGGPTVEIGYDPLVVRGWIMLKVPPDGLALQVRQSDGLIQLQDLRPLMVPLDRYRLAMGSNYDLRLLNFRIRVEVRGGGRTCVFGPAGDPPPDGEIISPCVTLAGQPECGEASRDGVRFAPTVHAAVRGCLGIAEG